MTWLGPRIRQATERKIRNQKRQTTTTAVIVVVAAAAAAAADKMHCYQKFFKETNGALLGRE